MTNVFISYARKYETFARQLATALSNSGAEVWVDVEDIPAGMNWSRAVQNGLDTCDVMLVIVTEESMASRNVENEWQYYLDEGKPVIPIRLTDAKTHFQLRRLQYIDFEHLDFDIAYAQLYRELRRLGFDLTPPAPLPELASFPVAEAETASSPPAVQAETIEAAPPVSFEPVQPLEATPKRRRWSRFIPVLAIGAVAAIALGALVTIASFNLSYSTSVQGTQTAGAIGTFNESLRGSLVGATVQIVRDVFGTMTAEVASTAGGEAASINPDAAQFADKRPLLAFASARDGDFDIYLFDFDSGDVVPLTVNDCDDTQPAWSPDGESLVYVSACDRDVDPELFIIHRLGDEPAQLTYGQDTDSFPLWSSDGLIYFASTRLVDGESQTAIYSNTPQGSDEQQWSDSNVGAYGFSFAPDLRQLVYVAQGSDGWNLIIHDGDTGEARQITSSTRAVFHPAWSPNGLKIAYVENWEDLSLNKLHVYDVETGDDYYLAEGGTDSGYPAWSPDGERLVWYWSPGGDTQAGLYVFDLPRGDHQQLLEDSAAASPAWRP